MDIQSRTRLIKEIAHSLGFQFCGISNANFLEDEAPKFEAWLKAGKHGEMTFMEKHFDKRLDPRLLVSDAKSVVSLLLNYYPEQVQREDAYKLSKYAYGNDYHAVTKAKLTLFLAAIREQIGAINARSFVDSGPVMDKAWATRSGLGWQGKNGNLIHPKAGSFFFIAELILDLELEPDGPIKDYCGNCTKCMDACPTDALNTPYVVDGSKCISYLTIELKKSTLPKEFAPKMDDWMFGCDVCQDVCPWNRFSTVHNEPLFLDSSNKLSRSYADWDELTEEHFNVLFENSPVQRTSFDGLKRNISFLKTQE